MMQRSEALRTYRERLNLDTAGDSFEDRGRLIDAIGDVTKGGLRELAPEIRSHLTSPDPDVRAQAVWSLSYWRLDDFRDVALQIWEADEDEEVRFSAFVAVTRYLPRESSVSDDESPHLARFFYSVLADTQQPLNVRDQAMSTLARLLMPDRMPADLDQQLRRTYLYDHSLDRAESLIPWDGIHQLFEERAITLAYDE